MNVASSLEYCPVFSLRLTSLFNVVVAIAKIILSPPYNLSLYPATEVQLDWN